MTDFDAGAAIVGQPAPPQRSRHLGRHLLIDTIFAGVGFLVIALAVPLVFVALNAAREGLSIRSLAGLDQQELLRLVGAPGIFAMLLLQNAFFVVLPLMRARWRHEPLASIGWTAPQPLKLVLFGIGLGIAVLVSNALLGLVFVQFGVRQNQSAQYPLFAGDYLGQALFFLGAAVLAPLGEEALFRGYLFNGLRRLWGTLPAFVVSALLFSLAHSLAATQGIVALLVPAFVMGLILAWGMRRTGSLVPCVIAHAMNNGLALSALLVCVNNPGLCPAA